MKTIGDSFFIAFTDPMNAVAFAVAMQLDMRHAPWPPSLLSLPDCLLEKAEDDTLLWRGLRVRVGIHIGVAKLEIDTKTFQVTPHIAFNT